MINDYFPWKKKSSLLLQLKTISILKVTRRFLINMNQTKFDTFGLTRKWKPSKSHFYNHSINTFMLQIYFIFTALAIIISKGALLRKLFKKRYKTRADKIFIILSCSDIGVGLFSIPIISLPLFKWDVSAFDIHNTFDYIYHFIWIFSACFPYGFSWILVVIIALDRVFIITKGQMYKQYITMKTLYWIITFCLLFILAIVTIFIMRYELFKRYSQAVAFIVLFTELLFIFIIILAYIYLFYFARSKSREMTNKRHGGTDLNKRLTLTVTYTYLCLLLFTIPQVAKQVIQFTGVIRDLRTNMHLEYWGNILSYSNCYTNALIILYINRKKHK